jgi:hypothetical protein
MVRKLYIAVGGADRLYMLVALLFGMPNLSALPNAHLDPVTAARRQRRVLATAT